ncbi:hypothetical protein C8J57DRAFT_1242310 [Mycena rebaudengoi]|nr:hypothetical protein C8J57DRAFT_1242310 [Mycena rebaudengoi]
MPSNNLDSDSDSDDGRRVNDDLPHKLADVARTFQRKLAKQEAESEGLQVKLEETCNELSVAKCEEELRIKERQNSAQIEEEVDKGVQQLEQSKASCMRVFSASTRTARHAEAKHRQCVGAWERQNWKE